MKKIIANLLIVMFILCSASAHRAWSKAPVPVEHPQNQPPVEGILKQASIKINATDPTAGTNFKGSFYPGGRGNNQLIIIHRTTACAPEQMNLARRRLLLTILSCKSAVRTRLFREMAM